MLTHSHLDLPLIASLIFLLIWVYPQLSALFFQYSSRLTLGFQSNSFLSTYLDLPSNASLVAFWLHYTCLSYWTYTSDAKQLRFFKNSDLSELPSSFRRSFWSFYRVQGLFSFCVPISDKKTYIWCNVSCNVWLCMNEMSKHLNSFFSEFVSFLFHFSSS